MIKRIGRKIVDTASRAKPIARARYMLTPPVYPGVKITPKRMFNLWLSRWEQGRGSTKLRAYPTMLTIESTNVCNLRCPYCFTGAGESGREKTMLQMPLYKQVLDELGDRLFAIEFYNWGEPFLNKNIHEMIGLANDKGISTFISTNFSIPFDAERAEKIVASGLKVLGVSLDGATQASYEQYRVRGDLSKALDNVRLINEAKKKLDSATPKVVWEFHVFQHNRHEIDQARAMAEELGMSFTASKGWVAGPDWDPEGEFEPEYIGITLRCYFLWQRAVIHNDAGVAPCCGTFYQEDDYGNIRGEPSVPLSSLDGRTFREVWNNEKFRTARGLFGKDRPSDDAAKRLICYDCPATATWHNYADHVASGKKARDFRPDLTLNQGFNFFFERRPNRAAAPKHVASLLEPIELVEPPAEPAAKS